MSSNSSLVDIYDGVRDVQVFRHPDGRAVVALGRAAVIVRPWEWNETPEPAPERMAIGLRECFAATGESSSHVRLSELLVWASRRGPRVEESVMDAETYETIEQFVRLQDPQRCGDYLFDRRLIREALQTWVEARTDPDALVTLRIIPHNGQRAMTISGDGTDAVLMCLMDDGKRGNDPMPWMPSKPMEVANG